MSLGNNNISQKDKMLVSTNICCHVSNCVLQNTMPLGLVLSFAIVMVKKLDKEINCVLYSTLLQNVLGILMGTQYMLKNN